MNWQKKKTKKLTETNVTNEKLRTKTETSSPQLHISWPTQSPWNGRSVAIKDLSQYKKEKSVLLQQLNLFTPPRGLHVLSQNLL